MKDQVLRGKILAFNKAAAERAQKAGDLDVLVGAIASLPYGQMKKLLSEQVLAVLAKYGYVE